MEEVFFCLVVPLFFLIALIAGIIWLIRRFSSPSAAASAPLTPAALLESNAFSAAVEQLLHTWVAQGRLPHESAAQALALLHEDRAARAQRQPRAPIAQPQPLSPAAQSAPTPLGAPLPAASITPSQTVPLGTQPLPQPPAVLLNPGMPVAALAAAQPAMAAPGAPAMAAPPQGPPLGERLWGGLLALRTRQTLLFLGAFLLVISALILVVFNWASFPPILQFALLAAVCGGLWVGGHLISSRWGLTGAGIGLRAIGAALTPVVAFSLSRPGLLELSPRGGWLLASALSLPIYLLATWRLRHIAYAVASCLALVSAVLAAISFTDVRYLPAALIAVLATYLPLARWLRPREPRLANGPAWVAHAGVPLALLWALLLVAGEQISGLTLALTLFAAAGFYLLATALERRVIWAWAAAGLLVGALLTLLSALDATDLWWALVPALAALAALALATLLEPRARAYAIPAYIAAAILAFFGLLFVQSWETARPALPVLLIFGVGVTLAIHRGRFSGLAERVRVAIATLGLALAAGLIPAWALALLDLTTWSYPEQGLALLSLAALAFLAAYWWPGRLRKPYDLALQAIGALVAIGAGSATLFDESTAVIGMVILTVVWLLQVILRRRGLWAALAMGSALLAAFAALNYSSLDDYGGYWHAVGLLFAGAYAIGGTLLRRSSWRFMTWPGLLWGALLGSFSLLAVVSKVAFIEEILGYHVAAVAALAGLIAITAALWRQAWPGYLVAALLSFAVLLAASQDFFLGWTLADAGFGYVLCGLTLGLALLGQGLRRIAPRYAHPYEIVGFALLTTAPWPAAGDSQHATLVWLAMALLYALAAWRYKLPWALAPALLTVDMALLRGADWLGSGGRAADVGRLLLAAAWVQAGIGLYARYRERGAAALPLWLRHSAPAYLVALLSGAGALLLASSASDALALVALGLAMLAALVGTIERREEVAWGALVLLALGLATLHDTLGITALWSMAWGVAEALALCMIGWALEWTLNNRQTNNPAISNLQSPISIWQRPLWLGPLIAGGLLTLQLLLIAPIDDQFAPLTFGLATFALLLATLAVRRRTAVYAYAAGAALVAAGLCQLYDWGFREPQWYAIPAGLYLLALAEGLRRFQGQRGLSQVIEAGAAVLMLGTTLGQSLRADGLTSQLYAAWLCCESLLLLGYGVMRRLRVPFFGGVAFFVIGVLWLSVDPLMATNKWVLLGCLGLLLVGAYVLLERRQEQLARAGRAWIERISGWS